MRTLKEFQNTFFWLETRSLFQFAEMGFRALKKRFQMRKLLFPLTLLLAVAVHFSASAQTEMTVKAGFVLNAADEHSFIFVLNNRPKDLPEVRTGITKYIWKYHPSDKLKITQIKIDGDLENVPLIHITGFESKAKAMEFYAGLKKNRPDFLQMGMTEDYFAVSKSNYETIVRSKSLNGYKSFFEQNYLK
jgi:hypothetical protein